MDSESRSTVGSLRRRTAAFALDYLLIAGYLVVLVGVGVAFRALFPSATDTLFGNPAMGELTGFLLITLPVVLYFALSEASSAQATWGKRRLGLQVVDAGGSRQGGGRLGVGRIGIVRSLVRSAVKFLPWELAHALIWQYSAAGAIPPPILDVGLVAVWGLVGLYLLSALLDARRRTVYDRLAGTAVVRRAGYP